MSTRRRRGIPSDVSWHLSRPRLYVFWLRIPNDGCRRVTAIGALAIAVAVLGTGCRDDGNDHRGANGTTNLTGSAGESDVVGASSNTDESVSSTVDATDAGTADAASDEAPGDGPSPTGSAPPPEGGAPRTTAVAAPSDASGDTRPPSSDPLPNRAADERVDVFVPVGTVDVTTLDGDGAEPPGPPHYTAGMRAEFTVG